MTTADYCSGVHDPIIPVSVSISGDTGSEKGLSTAFRWYEQCVREHNTLCRRIQAPSEPPLLPTRVLDVKSNGMVRLFETGNLRGVYACLSHCWGDGQPLKTTLVPDTLTLFQEGIEWQHLPKTFQDAIVVTRRFSIQYLWIDSLCIIQDDQRDWQIQSARMADIYQNAIVTIAGSASSGPHEGLFRVAEDAHIDRSLSSRTDGEAFDNIRTRKALSHDAAQLPLVQRGWVLQERLLSPRCLHFGTNELIWECMELLLCECGSLNLQETNRYKWPEPKHRLHPDLLRYIMTPNLITTAWQASVVDYSRMILSHPEDIFPAISGIAKSITAATGWTYVAGLWKEQLVVGLTWRVERPEHAVRCIPWRAPSFSWASILSRVQSIERCRISYEPMVVLRWGLDTADRGWRTERYATVVETACEPAGSDLTGQLKSAYLILRGTLIEAVLSASGKPGKRDWQISPVGKEPLPVSRLWTDFDFDDTNSKMRNGDVVYCLKLVGASKLVKTEGSREYLLHLVLRLESAGGPKERTLERIGLLQDSKDPEAVQLEAASSESAIMRDALVKIV